MLADIKSRPGFASNLLIAPAGFWPEEASLESLRIVFVFLHRENLDLPTIGSQGGIKSCRNARKWVSGGVIIFYATCTNFRAERIFKVQNLHAQL